MWAVNSVSWCQGILNLASWKIPGPNESLLNRGANSKMLNSCDSFGFCIESDSSKGKRCLIDRRRGIADSGMQSSRVFHRSQYCTSTEMASQIDPTFKEPVQSKWIVNGTLSAREIQRFAILFEGRSRVTVIDDHSAWVDNATRRQPMQTWPTSKGERSGSKLGIPWFGM